MDTYSKTLLAALDAELEIIHSNSDKPLEYSAQAVEVLIPTLRKLKTFISTYTFKDREEEIFFFKHVKPQFVYRLIYYNEVYIIESNRPYGGSKFDRNHIKYEIGKLKGFIDSNIDFYRYFRTGNTSCDESYFLRGKPNLSFGLDSFYFDSDHDFSTSHDFKIARFMANDLLFLYLHQRLSEVKIREDVQNPKPKTNLTWTAQKVYLIELVYALHTAGVFNNGTVELKTLVSMFSELFCVDTGQFYRTFLEIRNRKSDRTKFLNFLIKQLIRKMDEADD